MKRRIAKKMHRREVERLREELGHPVPCPPANRTGELLVPEGYVGPVLITTPSGRRKVRFVDEKRRVWRDDQGLRGGGFSIGVHAGSCRVEPCAVTPTASFGDQAALLSAGLVVSRPSWAARPARERVSA